jgi:acetyl esterase/lipase
VPEIGREPDYDKVRGSPIGPRRARQVRKRCTDGASSSLIDLSPLRATLEELRGLPPALLITGEYDVLRDEGEAYAHKLTEAGVQVTAVRYLGTVHDFMLLNAITADPGILARNGFHVVELPFQAHPDIPPGGVPAGPRTGPTYAMLEREAREAGLPAALASALS